MQLAKVVGSVVATAKDPALESRTLLVIQPIAPSGFPSGEALVAIDGVGVGSGEEVIFVKGREAAFAFLPGQVLADAAIVGKVDSIDVGGEGSGARPAFAELRRVRRSPKGGGGSSPSSSEERAPKK